MDGRCGKPRLLQRFEVVSDKHFYGFGRYFERLDSVDVDGFGKGGGFVKLSGSVEGRHGAKTLFAGAAVVGAVGVLVTDSQCLQSDGEPTYEFGLVGSGCLRLIMHKLQSLVA